ncbi:MAG: hypothetical protein J5544_00390 [Clostridia bacterium]|nr:hypothetical protein [Clostridia bacterium]
MKTKKFICATLSVLLILPMLCCAGEKADEASRPDEPGNTAAPGETAGPGGDAYVPDHSYNPETDFDKRLSREFSNCCFIDYGDVLYWYTDHDRYIRWCEKSGGEWGVLCARPECEHDGGNAQHVNNECGGHIGLQEPYLWIWEDKLYYVWTYAPSETSFGKLYRMDPDGTNRELVRELPPILTEEGEPFYAGTFYMHRGLIYVSTQREEVVDAEPVYRDAVAVCSLTGTEFKTIYTPDYSEHRFHYINLNFAGDHCYIFDAHGNGTTISRWNAVTGETELLYDGDEMSWIMYGWITEEGELYAASMGTESHGCEKVVRLVDGCWEEVLRFEDGEKQWTILTVSDGVAIARNFIPYDPDDPAGYSERIRDTNIDIWVMTYGGETLYKGKLPMDWMDETDPGATFEHINLVCGDEGGFMMQFELHYRNASRSNEPIVHALLKYDFTAQGIDCTLLARNYSKITLEF